MQIDKDYELEFKSGYFIVHRLAVKGQESKQAGEQYRAETQTYPNLLCAWAATRDKIADPDKMLLVGEQLIIESRKQAGRELLKERQKKLKKEVESNAQ